jgi:hypothetical protein
VGRSQRQKGCRGERKLATELRAWFPEYASVIRRGWQSRRGSDESDILGIPGYHLEHKSGAQPNVRAALRQAVEDSAGRGIPVAVVRDDRREPFVALRAADFWPLLRRAMGLPVMEVQSVDGDEVEEEEPA